jgi:hypothetical protein
VAAAEGADSDSEEIYEINTLEERDFDDDKGVNFSADGDIIIFLSSYCSLLLLLLTTHLSGRI